MEKDKNSKMWEIAGSLDDVNGKTAFDGMRAGDKTATEVESAIKVETDRAVAKEAELDPADIVFALDALQSPVSLHEPVYSDGGDTLYVMDQIGDKKNREERWVDEISLNEAMKRLPERERHIINLRFFEGKTQMEVADEIHISQAQVSRLEKNALKVMRNYLI